MSLRVHPATTIDILVGDTPADRPPASGVSKGSIFYCLSTADADVMELDPVLGTPAWYPLATAPRVGRADARPAATAVHPGTSYYAQDQGITYLAAGAAWVIASNPGTTDQVFFVDGVLGNDGNVGTAAQPFATLAAARDAVTASPHGRARINLVGAGPYALPPQTHGVAPQGAAGQPLVIVGDAPAVAASGTITAGAGTGALTTSLTGAAEAYRGLVFHNTTAGKTDQYFLLKDSTPGPGVVLQNNTGVFGTAAVGDTFEVLANVTVVAAHGVKFTQGQLGFWRCALDFGPEDFANEVCFDGGIVCCFDACSWGASGARVYVQDARVYGCPFAQLVLVNGAAAFNGITDIGTPASGVTSFAVLSNAGLWSHGLAFLEIDYDTAYFTANYVTDSLVSSLDGEASFLQGFDYYNPTAPNTALATSRGVIRMGFGPNTVRMAGAGCIGAWAGQSQGYMDLVNTTFTNCGIAAVRAWANAVVRVARTSGALGNGVGCQLQDGGMAFRDSGTDVTGAAGDVQIDGQAAKPWSVALGHAGVLARSTAGMPGTRAVFAGGLLGAAAGLNSFYLPLGGLRGSAAGVNNAGAPQLYPVGPGGLGQNLFVNVSPGNALTAAAVFAILRGAAPTALTVTFLAGGSGTLSDVVDGETWNDGDAIDCRVQVTGGGAGNAMSCAVGVQLQ